MDQRLPGNGSDRSEFFNSAAAAFSDVCPQAAALWNRSNQEAAGLSAMGLRSDVNAHQLPIGLVVLILELEQDVAVLQRV